jgi:glucose-1-phosphate thymidylyltransferase
MKGAVLAGGLGKRLHPLTKVTNKHLLPICCKPMIYYPIETLVEAGICEIMVVTGGESAGDFLKLLGNGKEFGLRHLDYTYQDGERGIADAVRLCEHFAEGDRLVVILGDNILEESIKPYVEEFASQEKGAKILLKEVPDAHRFGVAEIEDGKVLRIEEKPAHPKTNLAQTGVYMYDNTVFDIIRHIKPSQRDELEITDVNNIYIERAEMTFNILQGWWTDAGTFQSLLKANVLVANKIGLNPG